MRGEGGLIVHAAKAGDVKVRAQELDHYVNTSGHLLGRAYHAGRELRMFAADLIRNTLELEMK